MMEKDEITAKVRDLMSRHQAVLNRKAELGGKLQAKKEELAKLCEEIRTAGYDPATLVDAAKKAEADLLAEISTFEAELSQVEKALAVFDHPTK
jgi:uncharacterized coiled-coil DUF342 family protein